jgi:LysR family glycine cleavage system transcriptional activator
VQDDIAKGRLVVPFKIALPVDAGFYLVSPEGVPEPPKLRAFRQWLIASAKNNGVSALGDVPLPLAGRG